MNKKLKADLLLLMVTIVWGASFTLMKNAIRFIPPYTFLSLRYLLAALFLGLIFFKSLKKINAACIKYGFIIGVSLFGGCALQAVGLQYTTASKSGFITGLNVVLVPIFLSVIYKKLPPAGTMISVLSGVIGLGFLTIGSSFNVNAGDMLTLVSAVFFAFQIILISRYSPGLDPILLTIVEMLTVSALSFMPGIVLEHLSVKFEVSSVFALVFTALFCSSLAYLIQMAMQKYTTPVHTALIFIAEPVFSLFFAILISGETLTPRGILGCVLILAGMIFSEFMPLKKMSFGKENKADSK